MKSPFATGVGSVLRPMAPGAVEKQGKNVDRSSKTKISLDFTLKNADFDIFLWGFRQELKQKKHRIFVDEFDRFSGESTANVVHVVS